MAGLVGLRVETAPLRLWVEPGSAAATNKVAFDASFGPFYRIEQIVLSTPRAPHGKQAPILTREALELVFSIHEAVNALAPRQPHRREVGASDDGGVGPSEAVGRSRKGRDDGLGRPVMLQDVCYKPFGTDCAVESVAQYWQLDRARFDDKRALSLDYCLSHWSTACR